MEIVIWDNKYITGIGLIDHQHKQLVDLTNELYSACHAREEELCDTFKHAMSGMVEYVHFHFSTELELLRKLKFPEYHEHKMMHDTLIQNILTAAKDFNEGKKFVPNHFVRTLKDWIFSHIAIHDKEYALYVKDQIRLGLLTQQFISDIERSLSHQ